MKGALWFLLSCKRYLKRLPFVFLFFALPLGAFAVSRMGGEEDDRIRIALCAEDTEGLAARTMEELTGPSEARGEMFVFYACSDEEAVREEVASRRAECGYVFYEGLEEKLDAGEYRRAIGVYTAPSTVTASLASETVFAALIRNYDKDLLQDYVMDGQAFDGLGETGNAARKEAALLAGELYNKWSSNGGTFRFVYEEAGEEQAGYEADAGSRPHPDRDAGSAEMASSGTLFPLRGLVAVYVFIAGLYSAVSLGEDERKGLFYPLAPQSRLACRAAVLAAPLVLAAASGLLALAAGGLWESAAREISAMAVYAGTVGAVSWILKWILRQPQILLCTIPFFVIGSLVFCPVFIDGGRYVEGVDAVGRLFLPYYYLQFFA